MMRTAFARFPALILVAGVLASLLGDPAAPSLAACRCECVDGEVRALCTSSLDIQPICPPRICPIVPPSIAPIMPPTIPPIGTERCRMVQVLNPHTNRYEWRRVCR